jgi:hypothetical protein
MLSLSFKLIYSNKKRKEPYLLKHPLSSLETKALVQEDFASSLRFVKRQIQVLLSCEQSCFIKGLNMIPPLDAPLAEKAISDALLDEAGVEERILTLRQPVSFPFCLLLPCVSSLGYQLNTL